MPTELRHLLFRPDEVVQAVKEYRRRMGHALAPGTIVSCGPECGSSGEIRRFRLTLAPDEKAAPARGRRGREELVIQGPVLAAALILFCRDRHIPLAANASKSLQLFGNQVCLVTTINPGRSEMVRPTRS